MISSDDELMTPKPKPKRRSIYENLLEQHQIKPIVDVDYTKMCLLEIESQQAMVSEMKKSYREIKNLPTSIEIDWSKLSGKQKKFFKKKPNYNDYLKVVEDLGKNVQDQFKKSLDNTKANIEEKFKVLDALQDKLIYKT